MNSKLSNLLKLGAVFVLTASTAFGARYDRKDRDAQQQERTQGHMVKENQMMGGYNASARYDVQSPWDFFFTGEFLYWQQKVDGLILGVATDPRSNAINTGKPLNGKILNPDFGWHPGVRLSLGMNAEGDDWVLELGWTHLVSHNTTKVGIKTANLNTHAILMSRILADDSAFNASTADQTLRNILNIIDLKMGRPFYSGKDLTLQPHVGFRASWMSNSEDREYTMRNTTPVTQGPLKISTTASNWALGPRFGMDSNWLLGMGVRFFGNVAASLQYVKYNYKFKELDPNLAIPGANIATIGSFKDSKGHSQFRTAADSSLGFGWGTYFDNSNWHVDISLAYDFSVLPGYYPDLNMPDESEEGYTQIDYRTVAYHGGSFKIRFDF